MEAHQYFKRLWANTGTKETQSRDGERGKMSHGPKKGSGKQWNGSSEREHGHGCGIVWGVLKVRQGKTSWMGRGGEPRELESGLHW